MKLRIFARQPNRFGCCESGQSILEVAVAAPFLLLLLSGCIDFGRYTYDAILLGNGARAGVQFGTQNTVTADTSDPTAKANIQNAALADANYVPNVTATATNFCSCSGNGTSTCGATDCPTSAAYPTNHRLTFVQVTMTGTFTPLISIPGLPSSITITRTAVGQVSPG
jgi:Flp pilus assembly protein TadG